MDVNDGKDSNINVNLKIQSDNQYIKSNPNMQNNQFNQNNKNMNLPDNTPVKLHSKEILVENSDKKLVHVENIHLGTDHNEVEDRHEEINLNNRGVYDFPVDSGREEIIYEARSGCAFLWTFLAINFSGSVLIGCGSAYDITAIIVIGVIFILASMIIASGLFKVEPNIATVLVFNGNYLGTIRDNGYFWTPPFVSRHFISQRKCCFETDVLKVNDHSGSPIMIQCVIVWKVHNTAKVFFDIQNINTFIRNQSETSLRSLAALYPYDKSHPGEVCLKDGCQEVNKKLIHLLQIRMDKAGIKIIEAKLNRLNYSVEVAESMLKRQQAEAIISARQKIVNGGVGIVHSALRSLKENNVCEMNEEEKTRLASNLLMILVSENSGQN